MALRFVPLRCIECKAVIEDDEEIVDLRDVMANLRRNSTSEEPEWIHKRCLMILSHVLLTKWLRGQIPESQFEEISDLIIDLPLMLR